MLLIYFMDKKIKVKLSDNELADINGGVNGLVRMRKVCRGRETSETVRTGHHQKMGYKSRSR